MIASYQHIVDDDVIEAFAEKNGSDIPRKPRENLKTAEPLKIADVGLQLGKIMENNRVILENNKNMGGDVGALRELVDEEFRTNENLRKEMEDMKKKMADLLAELHGD